MRLIDFITKFFSSWRFPVVMISTMMFTVLLMTVTLLIPESESAASAFAREFKVWCFGYDPSTGDLEWAYVWMFLVQPWVMMALVALVWMNPLREGWRDSRIKMAPYALSTMFLVLGVAGALVASSDSEGVAADPSQFPGERIRTHIPAPAFSLVNHEGTNVSMESLTGEVVLITAVYTRCGYSCPRILAQTRGVLAALAEAKLDAVKTLAITLDPERDSVEDLERMVRLQKLSGTAFQALTGEIDTVNETLDKFGFARTVIPETGEIDHANLFILIDRQGKIAFRFALGEIQEKWMVEAVRLLAREERRQVDLSS